MKHTKRQKTLKPSSYILLSEFTRASQALAHADTAAEIEEYQRISTAADAKLDALALADPEEATRIIRACPAYFDEAIDDSEVYLGCGIYADKSELITLNTPEKRAAYIERIYAAESES